MGRLVTRRIDLEAPVLMSRADYDRTRRAFYRVTGIPRLIGEDGSFQDALPKLVPPGSFVVSRITSWREPTGGSGYLLPGWGLTSQPTGWMPIFDDPASDYCPPPSSYYLEPELMEGEWREVTKVPTVDEAKVCAYLMSKNLPPPDTAPDLWEHWRSCAARESMVVSREWVRTSPPRVPEGDLPWTGADDGPPALLDLPPEAFGPLVANPYGFSVTSVNWRKAQWGALGVPFVQRVKGALDARNDEWWYDTEWGQEPVWFIPPVARDEQGWWGPAEVMDLPEGDELVLMRDPHPFISPLPPGEGTVVLETASGSGTFRKVRAPFALVPLRKTARLWYDLERLPEGGHLGLSLERRRSKPSRWTRIGKMLPLLALQWGAIFVLGPLALTMTYGAALPVVAAVNTTLVAATVGGVATRDKAIRGYYEALAKGASYVQGWLPVYPQVVQELAILLQGTTEKAERLRLSLQRRNQEIAAKGGPGLKAAQTVFHSVVSIAVGFATGGASLALQTAMMAAQAAVTAADTTLKVRGARELVADMKRRQREFFNRATEERVSSVIRDLQFERLELERELALMEELEKLLREPETPPQPAPPPALPTPKPVGPVPGSDGSPPVSADDVGEGVVETLKKVGWAIALLKLAGG